MIKTTSWIVPTNKCPSFPVNDIARVGVGNGISVHKTTVVC